MVRQTGARDSRAGRVHLVKHRQAIAAGLTSPAGARANRAGRGTLASRKALLPRAPAGRADQIAAELLRAATVSGDLIHTASDGTAFLLVAIPPAVFARLCERSAEAEDFEPDVDAEEDEEASAQAPRLDLAAGER